MTIDPEAPVETAVGVEEGPDAQDEDHGGVPTVVEIPAQLPITL
jgi:hypothetical protein